MVFNENAEVGGTPYFLSSYGHLCLQPSRRDDLISLGYMLLYLINGRLPWHDVKGTLSQKMKTMCQSKVKTSIKDLCNGLPEEFCLYFEHVLSLRFPEKPNYNQLLELFEKIMMKKELENDSVFDWSNLKKFSGIDLDVDRMPYEPLTKYIKIINDSRTDIGFEFQD